jgi:hypothetical protein
MTTVTPESRLCTAGRLRVRSTRRRRPAVDNRGFVAAHHLYSRKFGLVQSRVAVCKGGSHCLPAVEWEVQSNPLPQRTDNGYHRDRYTLLC